MNKLLLTFLLVWVSCLAVRAQQPLSLSLLQGQPDTPPGTWPTGSVFQVGSQFGDASIYALFGGTGTRLFQIASPGESLTKTVTSTGYFSIRPTASILVDRNRVLNFSGTVSGSVPITVRPLTITMQLGSTSGVTPGSPLSLSFTTGVGTFPTGLGFQVQLFDGTGNFVQTLPSSQTYTSRESVAFSSGDARTLTSTLPTTINPGTYRVRVVTTGTTTTVSGTLSPSFQVQAVQGPVTTIITDIKPHTICAGYSGNIELTWSATDNGLQAQQYTIAAFPINATNTSNPIQSIINQGTYTLTSGNTRTLVATTTQLNSLPAGQYKLAILHAMAATTASFSNEFLVASASTAAVSDGTTNINEGEMATVRLTFSGTGPWSYNYNDLRNGIQTVTNSTVNPVLLSVYPTSDYTFSASRLLSFTGYCGTGIITGSSLIRVSRLALSLTSVNLPNTCPGNTITANFTVNGNISANTRYRLQLSDANGSFASPRELASGTSSPLSGLTPVNDGPGTGYKLRIISEGTVLASNSFDITFTRPAVPIVTDYNFCLGTTPSSPTAIGTNLLWFSNNGIEVAYGNTSPTPPSNQSSSYRVSQTVNGCPSGTSIINVTAKQKSSLPAVITPVTYCQNQLATNLTAQGSNLIWYNANGQNVGLNVPLPVTSNVGTQTFSVSQDQNGCRSDLATITVMIPAPPATPTLTTVSTVCQFAQVSNLVLTNAVIGQAIRWYDTVQGGTASSQAPTPRTDKDGTEVYYVSQILNGCESGRARLEQTVIKAPVLPSVSANVVLYCMNDIPRSLTAIGTGLRWYTQETGSSFTTSAPAPPTDRIGTTTYYVSQVVGINNCESPRLQLDVQVLSRPSAPQVASLQYLCQNASSTALRATGIGLQWSGPGIVSTSGTAPFPPTNSPVTLTYLVSQRIGSCTGPASTIQVTVRPQPTAPTVASPLKLCQGLPTRALFASGDNLRWYETTNGTDIARGQINFSPVSAGNYNYYVSQVVDDCESLLSRLEVRVSVPARATLSGDSIVTLNDSTAIRIRFTGDAPYTLTLWNGRTLTTSENPLIIWEKPTLSVNTYSLRSISNDCGSGNPGNTYRLTVRTPLSTEQQTSISGLQLLAFPNPATGSISIKWSAPVQESIVLQVTSLSGFTIWEGQREGTGNVLNEILPIDHCPIGIYILKLRSRSIGQLQQRILLIR